MSSYNDRLSSIPTAVYRLYDSTGQLLYVGMTLDTEQRFKNHKRDQFWWHLVARTDIQWFESRREAEEVESAAIHDEGPLYDGTSRMGPNWQKARDMRPQDPFWRPVADSLLARIRSGEYPPGARLPSTSKMAREYGVSLTSIRSALSWLDRHFIVKSNSGVAVIRPVSEHRQIPTDT